QSGIISRNLHASDEAVEKDAALRHTVAAEQAEMLARRQDPCAVRMPEQKVVEIRQQPDGHGYLGIGTRRTRQIEELGALLVAEDLQAWSHPFENVTHGEPGPCPHVGGRGGPERGEVTAREILDRKRGTGLLSEPRRKGGQRDEASSSPDATRRSE